MISFSHFFDLWMKISVILAYLVIYLWITTHKIVLLKWNAFENSIIVLELNLQSFTDVLPLLHRNTFELTCNQFWMISMSYSVGYIFLSMSKLHISFIMFTVILTHWNALISSIGHSDSGEMKTRKFIKITNQKIWPKNSNFSTVHGEKDIKITQFNVCMQVSCSRRKYR